MSISSILLTCVRDAGPSAPYLRQGIQNFESTSPPKMVSQIFHVALAFPELLYQSKSGHTHLSSHFLISFKHLDFASHIRTIFWESCSTNYCSYFLLLSHWRSQCVLQHLLPANVSLWALSLPSKQIKKNIPFANQLLSCEIRPAHSFIAKVLVKLYWRNRSRVQAKKPVCSVRCRNTS